MVAAIGLLTALAAAFMAFAQTLTDEVKALQRVQGVLCEVSMGGTAIGTGITAPPGYAEAVRAHLAQITGLELITAPDLIEATADG